jgi:hypothetical protein
VLRLQHFNRRWLTHLVSLTTSIPPRGAVSCDYRHRRAGK